jgi:transcriptional regulator of acetoin/glycerol metabolism
MARQCPQTQERHGARRRAGPGTRVEVEGLPEEVRYAIVAPVADSETVQPLEAMKKEHILVALDFNNGNQTRTSEQLKIRSANPYRKLKS